MAENQILVKFKPQGHTELINAIKRLGAAQNTLNKSMRALNITTDKAAQKSGILGTRNKRLTDENNKLANSFATIRSKMLLVSFAMSLGVRQIMQMTKETATLGAMSTAFETLSGGSENATVAIDKLREATNNTMSRFDLFQQANNAMVLGITKNSDEMAEMFDIAQRLGKALGQDTRLSVESLITGIGRQSRMMLDNIGIVVDTNKAYETYARTLKKNADDLTDAERKQAFLNATMESARAKVGTLNDETEDVQTSFQQFSAAAIDLQARLGDVFTAFEPLVIAMTGFMNAIDNEKIERFVETLKILGGILAGLVATGIIAFLGVMVYWFGVAGTVALAFRGIITKLGATFKFWAIPALTSAIYYLTGFKKEVEVVIEPVRAFTGFIGESADETERLNLAFANGATSSNELGETLETLTNAALASRLENELLNEVYSRTTQGQLEIINAKIESIDLIALEKGMTSELAAVLDFLIQKRDKLTDSTKKGNKAKKEEIQLIAERAIVSANANENIAKSAIKAAGKELKAHYAVVVGKYIKDMMTILPPPFNLAAAAGAGVVVGSLMDGAINTAVNAIPAMEQGGLIGGRRHSQGGTMINAEQGEFVMSRNAVEAIGVENLNRMNQGGSGAVNITFTGNVMSQDFIENEAIPQIKDAIRRGADIGVS